MIWKYKFSAPDRDGLSWIETPEGKVIHVDTQYGDIYVWVLFDMSRVYDRIKRAFVLTNTGLAFSTPHDEDRHLGSVTVNVGSDGSHLQQPIVWHVFEVV
jgi:hypothetical protein